MKRKKDSKEGQKTDIRKLQQKVQKVQRKLELFFKQNSFSAKTFTFGMLMLVVAANVYHFSKNQALEKDMRQASAKANQSCSLKNPCRLQENKFQTKRISPSFLEVSLPSLQSCKIDQTKMTATPLINKHLRLDITDYTQKNPPKGVISSTIDQKEYKAWEIEAEINCLDGNNYYGKTAVSFE